MLAAESQSQRMKCPRNKKTLLAASVVMRHGARTPKETLPMFSTTCDGTGRPQWPFPEGRGKLTATGKRDCVRRGIEMFERFGLPLGFGNLCESRRIANTPPPYSVVPSLLESSAMPGKHYKLGARRCLCSWVMTLNDKVVDKWWVDNISEQLQDDLRVFSTDSPRCVDTGASLLGGFMGAMMCWCHRRTLDFAPLSTPVQISGGKSQSDDGEEQFFDRCQKYSLQSRASSATRGRSLLVRRSICNPNSTAASETLVGLQRPSRLRRRSWSKNVRRRLSPPPTAAPGFEFFSSDSDLGLQEPAFQGTPHASFAGSSEEHWNSANEANKWRSEMFSLGERLACVVDLHNSNIAKVCAKGTDVADVLKNSGLSNLYLKSIKHKLLVENAPCRIAGERNKDLIYALTAKCGWHLEPASEAFENQDIQCKKNKNKAGSSTGLIANANGSDAVEPSVGCVTTDNGPERESETQIFPSENEQEMKKACPALSSGCVGLTPPTCLALLKRFCSVYDSFAWENYSLSFFVPKETEQLPVKTASIGKNTTSFFQDLLIATSCPQSLSLHPSKCGLMFDFSVIRKLVELYCSAHYRDPFYGWRSGGILLSALVSNLERVAKQIAGMSSRHYKEKNKTNKMLLSRSAPLLCGCGPTPHTSFGPSLPSRYCGLSQTESLKAAGPRKLIEVFSAGQAASLTICITHQSSLLGLQGALGLPRGQFQVPGFGDWISAELYSPGASVGECDRKLVSGFSEDDLTVVWRRDDGQLFFGHSWPKSNENCHRSRVNPCRSLDDLDLKFLAGDIYGKDGWLSEVDGEKSKENCGACRQKERTSTIAVNSGALDECGGIVCLAESKSANLISRDSSFNVVSGRADETIGGETFLTKKSNLQNLIHNWKVLSPLDFKFSSRPWLWPNSGPKNSRLKNSITTPLLSPSGGLLNSDTEADEYESDCVSDYSNSICSHFGPQRSFSRISTSLTQETTPDTSRPYSYVGVADWSQNQFFTQCGSGFNPFSVPKADPLSGLESIVSPLLADLTSVPASATACGRCVDAREPLFGEKCVEDIPSRFPSGIPEFENSDRYPVESPDEQDAAMTLTQLIHHLAQQWERYGHDF